MLAGKQGLTSIPEMACVGPGSLTDFLPPPWQSVLGGPCCRTHVVGLLSESPAPGHSWCGAEGLLSPQTLFRLSLHSRNRKQCPELSRRRYRNPPCMDNLSCPFREALLPKLFPHSLLLRLLGPRRSRCLAALQNAGLCRQRDM